MMSPCSSVLGRALTKFISTAFHPPVASLGRPRPPEPGKGPGPDNAIVISASAISVARAMRSSGMVTPRASQASVLT